MPTYEYICNACGHEFELFQSMRDSIKRKCPKCGKPKLERLIGTGAGVIFKGSGFYQTDYRSEGYKKAAEAETKAASGDSDSKSKDGKKDVKATVGKETPTPAASGTNARSPAPPDGSLRSKPPARRGKKQ